MQHLLALPAGTELVEDYRIERVLGAGGFGLTYLAREEPLSRNVTIKEYFPSDFAAREATLSVRPRSVDAEADYGWGLERFIDEAQTLARFDHPHINRVYRCFRANNTAYMVLQFEEGQSFKQWLASLGRAPRQAELDAILSPLLDALETIHGGNFLHRDIAPDNIIIRKAGGPVLIDFGSARGEMVQLSKTVSALVKPGYSPYEQYGLSGRQQGPWTDIYSLGATLYQAIGGKRPTDAPTRMVGDDYRSAASVALSSYRPQFLAAVDHALMLRPDDRPQSIAAWRKELMLPARQAPAKDAGVKASRAAPEPLPAASIKAAQPFKILNIFKRKSVESDQAAAAVARPADPPPVAKPTPAVAMPNAADIARTSFKQRLVRLLEGVAARPSNTPDPQPSVAPKPAKPDSKVAKERAAVDKKSPAALPVAGPKMVVGAKLPAAVAKPPIPAAKAAVRKSGSRGTAMKLLAGAALSAVLLYYQDQIASIWTTYVWSGVQAVRSVATPPTKPQAQPQPATSKRNDVKSEVAASATQRPASDADNLQAARRIEETVLKGHRGPVHAVAFAAGGASLASIGADGTLRLWDAAKGQIVRTLEAGENVTAALAVHDWTAAVGHQDGTIELWDLERGQRLRTHKRNDALIWSVTFAGDAGRVLAAAHDWGVVLWDQARTDGSARLLEGHENAVQAVAYGLRAGGGQPATALVATGSADKSIRLWSGVDLGHVRTYRGHRDFISAVAFAPDGAHLASASFDKTVKVWATADSGWSRTLRGHKARATAVAFSADGHVLASASDDGTVRFWDWKRSRVVRTLSGHNGPVRSVAFSADGKLVATAGEDGTIRLWDAVTLPRATASRT